MTSGPKSPVHLHTRIGVLNDSGTVTRYSPTKETTLWKGQPHAGKTPIYDKRGKLVGDIDTDELRKSEL